MQSFETLTEAMAWLQEQGYDADFNVAGHELTIPGTTIPIPPDEFVVDHVFRFEGDTDPADEAVLYGISVPKYSMKGILVDGYGASSDSRIHDVIRKLNIPREQIA